jgi:hypothetical protein
MNRLIAPALVALAFAASASAEPRNLSGFQDIAAENGVRVDVSIGPRFAVDVTGRDARYVVTEVRNGTLRISRGHMPWFGIGFHDFDGRIRITMPSLEGVSAARGAVVNARGVQAHGFAASAAMGGVIDVSGACSDLDASVAMGGVLSAEGLHCDSAAISASMGGTAEVFAARTYSASASMGGTVNVSGQAARGDVSTSMGGSVSQE